MKKLCLGLLLWAGAAHGAQAANDAHQNSYYQVGKVAISEELPTADELAGSYLVESTSTPPAPSPSINTTPTPSPTPAPTPTPSPSPTPTPSPTKPGDWLDPSFWDKILGGDWNKIILIGEKIIDIVKANQPVVNIKRDQVHAVPAGITDWQVLSGWKAPMTKVYRIQVKNKFDMTVVDARVKVSAMWGGSAAGRGLYLANVILVPTQTYVAWGWTFDLWTENRDPVNAGTTEQPIAALGFDVRYHAKTFLNDIQGTQDYYLTGDGQLQVVE